MDLKAEQTKRIRELEEEFSDEKMAEIFNMNDAGDARVFDTRRKLMRKRAARHVANIVIAVVCIIIVLQFFAPMIVFEQSMENTLEPRDCVVLAKRAYVFGQVAYGDVVVRRPILEDGDSGTEDLAGRIIGLPGDVIEIRDGGVYRNGGRLNEPYIKDGMTEGVMAAVTVPEDRYFVLGDNRQDSDDSRDARIGFVPKDEISGKVVFRLLPISKTGRLPAQ
jgi:signal peptidase I